MEDKDIKHLTWIYERLVHVHNENPNLDYMIRLKQIVDKNDTTQNVIECKVCGEPFSNAEEYYYHYDNKHNKADNY